MRLGDVPLRRWGVSPEDGTYFALLKTNSGGGTRVSQSFHAGPGDKISGKTFFVAGPVFPDTATVEIKLGGAVISAPFSAVQAFGNPAFYTGWVEWSYEFQPGDLEADYTIVATVTNAIAPALSSWLGLDGITLETASVPEPTDTTPPDIAATVSGTPGDNGWYVSDVTVSYTASDDESGLDLTASDLGDDVLTAEGAGQSASGTAVDNAGNSATALVENIDIDKTAPSISASVSPGANENGWNNSDVTVTFDCTDGGSGVASCDGGTVVTSDGADQAIVGTATDAAGNSVELTVLVSVDKTAPSISGSVSPEPNVNGWNNSDVTVTFDCIDDGSGVASCDGGTVVTSDGADQAVVGTATDAAGNSAELAVLVSVDKTAPVIDAPADQEVVATSGLGAVVSYSVSADGSVSGLASLVSSMASGSVFPLGATVVSHTATDLAGNEYSSSHVVTVLGPRDLKQRAIDALSPYVDESKRIAKAIKQIEKSLDAKLWVDGLHLDSEHGKKVFGKEWKAVKNLRRLLKRPDKFSDGAVSAAQTATAYLVQADRLLASVKIQETQDAPVLDSEKRQRKVDKLLAKANTQMDKGDAAIDAGKPDKAIKHYGKAWKYANKAMQIQMGVLKANDKDHDKEDKEDDD